MLLGVWFLAFSCKKDPATSKTTPPTDRWVNTAHLEHLYLPVKLVSGPDVGVINIYSQAPDYKLVGDDDEGFTCVDDVARAALFYRHEPDLSTNPAKQATLRKLTEFVLAMQAPNGYFYNFLWPDRTPNTAGQTSVAQPNWWSWRALWALSEIYPVYQGTDAPFAARIQTATQRVVGNMVRDFGGKPREYAFVSGLKIPKWLPYGSGTDQAAVMVLGLLNGYQQKADAPVLALINQLAEGILTMQPGTDAAPPYGAFLSFENNWHAYGNDQAYALLKAGKALNKPDWIAAALREVDLFYPYVVQEGFLESFVLDGSGALPVIQKKSKFSQIAYGIRPMISATLEAFSQKKDAKYAQLAAQLTAWYLGQNPASTKMYNPNTGRCFDGISSGSQVNKNSGAESTIEALWAFQAVEAVPEVRSQLEKYR